MIDPDFGFRPVLGNSKYTTYGTLKNNYALKKKDGTTRLLFLGDSVTYRAKIVNALKERYREEKYECWNAGVESFNTVQEVKFYKRYNATIRPDHLILTFHNNDFEITPVAFYDKERQLVVYTPWTRVGSVSSWFFRHSFLWRWILGVWLGGQKNHEAIEQEVGKSLRELRDISILDGIELTVIVLPLLKPFEDWNVEEKASRNRAIQLLKDLGVRHFDLLDTLHRAVESEVTLQEYPGDTWNPSKEVSSFFAQSLFQGGILNN